MKRKYLFSLLVLLVSLNTEMFAQKIAVRGGVNMANILAKVNNEKLSDGSNAIIGFHGGISAELPISDGLSFGTGLLISTKGTEEKFSGTVTTGLIESKHTLSLTYVDIPFHLRSNFGSEQLGVYILGGGYIGLGIVGKSTQEQTIQNETTIEEIDVEWGNDEDQLKSLDYGVEVGAGVDFGRVFVDATYQVGLVDVINTNASGIVYQNRGMRISIGYKLINK